MNHTFHATILNPKHMFKNPFPAETTEYNHCLQHQKVRDSIKPDPTPLQRSIFLNFKKKFFQLLSQALENIQLKRIQKSNILSLLDDDLIQVGHKSSTTKIFHVPTNFCSRKILSALDCVQKQILQN